MANDRYRYEQDRYRDERNRNDDRDDGYIARRGFGNDRSGYERGRERDFGDSAGYGTGGSALDWHDVMGDDRRRGRSGMGFDDRREDYSRSQDVGRSRDYGRSQDDHRSSGFGRDQDRSSYFGRGSRDYHEDRGFFEKAGDEVRSWFGDDDAERRRDRDESQHHRGRGPKGYQRSDARILEDVNDRLTEDPHVDASEIDVSISNREVTLSGTVNSRFEKRHAEDIAESVSGVTHVQNNLRVQQAAGFGMGGSMMSGAGAAGAGSVGNPGAPDTGMGGSSLSDATGNPAGARRRSQTPSA